MNAPQTCRWHEFRRVGDLEQAAVNFILDAASRAIDARGAFHIVLAGGNTPRNIYRAFCDAAVDWPAWQVYWGDERCVPATDLERNSGMARSIWLDQVAIPLNQIHMIPAELGPEAGAAAYTTELAPVGTFDLVLLGLGEDGHTASLFPGSDWERTADLPAALPVHDAPKPPPQRVSLSPARLSDALQVLFLVNGPDKREAVSAWRAGVALPASRIRPTAGVDVFLCLDDDAANLPTAKE